VGFTFFSPSYLFSTSHDDSAVDCSMRALSNTQYFSTDRRRGEDWTTINGWSLIHCGNVATSIHVDASGLGTIVGISEGEKIWVALVPKKAGTLLELYNFRIGAAKDGWDLDNLANYFDFFAFQLLPGDIL
jgi:hypothetical protein